MPEKIAGNFGVLPIKPHYNCHFVGSYQLYWQLLAFYCFVCSLLAAISMGILEQLLKLFLQAQQQSPSNLVGVNFLYQ